MGTLWLNNVTTPRDNVFSVMSMIVPVMFNVHQPLMSTRKSETMPLF